MTNVDRIAGLRQALAHAPENVALRIMLAELLAEPEGNAAEAATEYAHLLGVAALAPAQLVAAGRTAVRAADVGLLERVLAAARGAALVEGVGELEAARAGLLREQNVVPLVTRPRSPAVPIAPVTTTFGDVGGLDEVKKTIHRMIILPFQKPELYARYGRKAGGGVLLYGPPGCGKTLLARATAGECGLPFANVRIEDVLDPYLGVSERKLHEAFEDARARRPCVVFLDELDGLAFARGKHQGGAGRTLVDQLLQELDAIGVSNDDLLVLAATNAPWDVDDALKRPGRFDRLVFVPPPDDEARRRILEVLLRGRPVQGVDVKRLARDTPLFSGADLRALVDRGIDEAIEEALASDREPPLSMAHLERALAGTRPSTMDWLARARNYVEFANQSERYADVARFLKTKEARALKAWDA